VRREGPAAVASRAGIPLDRLERAASEASLALHKGMGAPAARLLEAAGVVKVSDLASRDPAELTALLSRVAAARRETAPRPEYVRVWVRAARVDGQPRR
jgi:predicted RecB family nuclease